MISLDGIAPRVTTLASAAAVPAAAWNALAGRGAHLHAWFVASEQAGWEARHLAVYDGDKLLLVVPAYFVTHADHDVHDRWLGPLRGVAAALGVRLRPLLVVGPPIVQTSAPIGSQDRMSDTVLDRVFDLLEAAAERAGARGIAWPFLDAADERIVQHGRGRGYTALYAGATAFLPVEWDSFDEYVASRSKNVRRSVRADLRALEIRGLRLEVTRDFTRHTTAVEALFRDFFFRRNGYASMLPPGFFERVAEQADPGIVAQLTWDAERLVGMSFNLMANGVMDGTFSAMTEEHEGGAAYYHDLIYTPLRTGCGEGLRRLELGPTALYAKVLRGAQLRRRTTLVRGMTPLTDAVLRTWGRQVARRTEQKEQRLLAPLGGARYVA